MKLALARKSDRAIVHKTTRSEAIQACSGTCGLILIACEIENKQLRRLKKFLIKEAGIRQPRLLYDVSDHVITIVFEGMTLSTTHWFGLAVKSFMNNQFDIKESVLVANFTHDQYPQASKVEEMINQLKVDVSESLIVYHTQFLQEKDRSVLIIDDDIVAGDFLKVQLESLGYEVHQAFDGVQGINSCKKFSPDIVITELNLPALDGFQVIRHIQGNVDLDSRIIVLSEQRLDKDISECLDLGVTEYITKPYSPVDLELILNKVLEEELVGVM